MCVPAEAEERDAGTEHQRRADGACQEPLLAAADPDECGTLQGPGRCRPAGVEGQRYRQRAERDRQRDKRLDHESQQLRLPPLQERGDQDVEQCSAEGAEGQAVFRIREQQRLHREGQHRRAEHQGTVDEA